jgi:hypothetical protein
MQDLAKGAHCSSCNIDYDRIFSRNVELTFHPATWIGPLPDGQMCLLGQGSARHIKFQGEVAVRSAKLPSLALAPSLAFIDQHRQAMKSWEYASLKRTGAWVIPDPNQGGRANRP